MKVLELLQRRTWRNIGGCKKDGQQEIEFDFKGAEDYRQEQLSGTKVQLPRDKQKLTEEIEDTKDFDD